MAETTAKEDRRFLIGYAAAVRAWRVRLRGNADTTVELARRALSLLPEEDLAQRSFAAVGLGDVLRTTGDLEAADEALAEALEIGIAADHAYGTLMAMVWRARVQMERGRLREAEVAFRRALRFVTERRVELLPAAGLAHVGMGALHYERNDLEEAERELKRGVELAERTGEVGILVWGCVTLSRVERARGDGEGALQMAREAELIARRAGANLEVAISANWMARLRLFRGDLQEAVSLESELLASAEVPDASWAVDRLTSARLLQARGRYVEALRLLEESRQAAEAAGRAGELIEVLALRASTLWAKGEKESALGALARAIELSEPGGYVRTFADEGAVMGDLLSEILEVRRTANPGAADRVSTRYLAKLLSAVAQDAAPVADGRLPEPLSERELEVLAFIVAGDSNAEIAGKLFVSVSTVKTHVNNLYRKLDAHSRTHAVARAGELGLI